MNHPLAPFLKRLFGHYLSVQKGLSRNTVLAYRDSVKLLLCHTADTLGQSVDELTVEDLTESRVLEFLDHIETVRECTVSTRNARLAAIRCLFAFIAREEPVLLVQCQQVRAIPLKRTQHKTVGHLEEKEMQAVLDAVDINSRTGIRDRALLLLAYNTGARVSEIVALEVGHLRLDESAQILLRGKGGKERTCPLWAETVAALEAYLRERAPKKPETQQVFLNANGGGLTRFGIRHITRKYGSLAEVEQSVEQPKPVNPHTLRHTAAMHLLRAGNEVSMISYWLGHADMNTTHIYVEIDMEMKRRMIDKSGAPEAGEKPSWRNPGILLWLNNLAKHAELCAVNE